MGTQLMSLLKIEANKLYWFSNIKIINSDTVVIKYAYSNCFP